MMDRTTVLAVLSFILAVCKPVAFGDPAFAYSRQVTMNLSAHVFDGGDPVSWSYSSSSGSSTVWGSYTDGGPYYALDQFTTRAYSHATFGSISPDTEDVLSVWSDIHVHYYYGYESDARYGGEGSGDLSQVVEFLAPDQQYKFTYDSWCGNSRDGFASSLSVTVENVTQASILFHLSAEEIGYNPDHFERRGIGAMSVGNPGDLIRITTLMSASGGIPSGVADSGGSNAYARLDFYPASAPGPGVIPEPFSAAFMASAFAGVVGWRLRRRRKRVSR